MMGQTGKPHYRRRSIRLPEVDYSAEGGYFITLVAFQREQLFGEIVDGVMRLSDYGRIAREEWQRSAIIRKEIELDMDEFVIMPNHIHGIVHIFSTDNNGKGNRPDVSDELGVRAYGNDEETYKQSGKGDRPDVSDELGVRAYGMNCPYESRCATKKGDYRVII